MVLEWLPSNRSRRGRIPEWVFSFFFFDECPRSRIGLILPLELWSMLRRKEGRVQILMQYSVLSLLKSWALYYLVQLCLLAKNMKNSKYNRIFEGLNNWIGWIIQFEMSKMVPELFKLSLAIVRTTVEDIWCSKFYQAKNVLIHQMSNIILQRATWREDGMTTTQSSRGEGTNLNMVCIGQNMSSRRKQR